MYKKNHKMKKTISVRQFISEFGGDFSEHMKHRLLELGARCVMIRLEDQYRLDLRHIEHTKYAYSSHNSDDKCRKEYVYGQFVMNERALYFSESCEESTDVMQSPIVNDIYNSLDSEEVLLNEGPRTKKVDDSNIDYIIDRILKVCPEISPEHRAIISKYC